MLGTVGPERTQRGGPGRCQLRPRGLPLAGANRRRPPCRVIERGVTQGRLGRGGSPAVASERSSAADRCHHVATPATRASTACRLRGPARSRAPPDAPPSPQDAPSPPTTHSTTVLRTPPTAPGPYPRRRMSLDSEEVLDAFTLVLELGGSVQTVNARGETALHGAAARAPTRSSRCSPSEAPVWMRPTTPDIPRWRSPRVSRSWCSDSSPRPQLSSVGWWRVARRRPARHGDTPTCRCLGLQHHHAVGTAGRPGREGVLDGPGRGDRARTCIWSSASAASTPTRCSTSLRLRIRPRGRGRGRRRCP